MSRQPILAAGAPAAIGPYSQAIEIDGFLFCSGQLGMDPATGLLVDGIEAQTERALRNLEAVLAAAAMSMNDVVKVTVFMKDLGSFTAMNGVYTRHMPDPHGPGGRSAARRPRRDRGSGAPFVTLPGDRRAASRRRASRRPMPLAAPRSRARATVR
jgi:2-iminobutanoate/2-iminopropanoate deaminase